MALVRLEDLITPEQKARTWRDNELARTDIAAMVSDFPNAEVILAYRVALRAWPDTNDFPDTRPINPLDEAV
jgi:hypothetical protein